MSIPTTPAALGATVSTLLTILFLIAPPLRVWFAAQTAEMQRAWRGVAVLFVALLSVALGCGGVITGWECTQQNIGDWLGTVVVTALAGLAGSNSVFTVEQVRLRAVRDFQRARTAELGDELGMESNLSAFEPVPQSKLLD